MSTRPVSSDYVAVVSGDVIGSSDLAPADRGRLSDKMRQAYERATGVWDAWLPYPLAIVGGDGWQFLVEDACFALHVTVYFRAALQAEAGVRARAAIAIDTVDFIKNENLNESDGPAFRRSGRALQELSRPTAMVCLLPEVGPPIYQLAADAVAGYADHIAQQWTQAQAQAVAAALLGAGTDRQPTQEEIAAAWKPEPITQQAVNKHFQKAHWERIERIVARFERLIDLWRNEPMPYGS